MTRTIPTANPTADPTAKPRGGFGAPFAALVVGAVAMGEQDARVDERRVGQAGDDSGQGFGAVAVQQLPED